MVFHFIVQKKEPARSFILPPLKIPKTNCWYSTVPLCYKKLASMVKRLCEVGGVKGLKANHSLRVTTAMRLYDARVDEQLICGKTD